MKRSLRQRKGEPLREWIDRLTEDILFHCTDLDNYRPELREILGEISKASYIKGVHAEQELE